MFVLMLLILAIVIITFVKIDNNDKNKPKDLTKVKLAEVTHSVFYAPLPSFAIDLDSNYIQRQLNAGFFFVKFFKFLVVQ